MSSERTDTVIIGGGQAGLAVGYYVMQQGRPFVILDAGKDVAEAWRSRWDSLRLFTQASYNGLPGMAFPGPKKSYPGKDEMADYLKAYAKRFDLPLQLGVEAEALERANGHYRVTARSEAGTRHIEAEHVVIATGPTGKPKIPEFADQLDPAVVQLHSTEYRNPDQIPDGPVLVVGAGNSGAEIATDLAANHEIWLAGHDTGRMPIKLGGFIYRITSAMFTTDTKRGRQFVEKHAGKATPLVRVRPEDLRKAGVQRVGPVVGVIGGRPKLDDDRVLDVGSVVWCTGFVRDYDWIKLPVFDGRGDPIHYRGAVRGEPALYFIGIPYLYSWASSLVGGVGRDAKHIAGQIAERRSSPTEAGSSARVQ